MSQRVFCLTIDVEPDCDVKWHRSDPLTFINVSVGIRDILQPLCQRFGVRPTYLISPEVLAHDASAQVLRDLTDCELGMHLHSEYIEPQRTYVHPAGTVSGEFPCQLPTEIEYQKLVNATELFRRQFGYAPRSYRAARYGADADTFAALAKLGYQIDTSVTPGIDWKQRGGPDFRGYPDQPYRLESGLLEVPVTIAGKRFPLLPDRWMAYRWLRPSMMTAFEMKRLIRYMADKYPERVVLNMMFHSMELIPQASPYVRSERGQKRYLARLQAVFARLAERQFQFRTLSEYYDEPRR